VDAAGAVLLQEEEGRRGEGIDSMCIDRSKKYHPVTGWY